jgi:hypothetical protein
LKKGVPVYLFAKRARIVDGVEQSIREPSIRETGA